MASLEHVVPPEMMESTYLQSGYKTVCDRTFRFAVEREGRMIGIVDTQIRLGTAFPMLSLPLREFSFTRANREPGRAFRKGVGGRPLAARGTELMRTDQGDRCKLYILDSWESASEQSEFDHVRGC
ncbi:hypothetical protein DEV91_13334 [Phyllobacterium brassicacearum]|nr:hypothetical protein DEV91_13334 [Phyllobacterium brassicacearum]